MTLAMQRYSGAPLVASRGLWDKYARPNSLGALRRAYLRGVPSLARGDAATFDVQQVFSLIADPHVNRQALPVFLLTNELPTADLFGWSSETLANLVAITQDGGSSLTWPMWRWNGRSWSCAGRYVSVFAARSGFSRSDLAASSGLVLYESVNVLTDQRCRSEFAEVDDLRVENAIRTFVGPQLTVYRVSDLVELEQLDRSKREAA